MGGKPSKSNSVDISATEMSRELQENVQAKVKMQDTVEEVSTRKLNSVWIEDKKLKEAVRFELSEPLNAEQVYQFAGAPAALFVMRFPSENDQYLFLDTVTGTLHYRPLPTTTDLSLCMGLSSIEGTSDHTVKWDTLVRRTAFYALTDERLARNSVNVAFGIVAGDTPPTWTMSSSQIDPTLLSFADNKDRDIFSIAPLQQGRRAVGTEGIMWTLEVQRVTNYNRHTLPFVHLDPPLKITEGDDEVVKATGS